MLHVGRQIVLGSVVLFLASMLTFGADAPATLTYQDLIGHPERCSRGTGWPSWGWRFIPVAICNQLA